MGGRLRPVGTGYGCEVYGLPAFPSRRSRRHGRSRGDLHHGPNSFILLHSASFPPLLARRKGGAGCRVLQITWASTPEQPSAKSEKRHLLQLYVLV